MKEYLYRFGRALVDILFLHIYSAQVRQFNLFGKFLLYLTALALFYVPIVYSVVILILRHPGQRYLLYFVCIVIVHVVSRVVLVLSKSIRRRFSRIHSKNHFFVCILLISEYIVLMWIVFLFYPISCILFPVGMLSLSVEKLLGLQFIYNAFIGNTEQFVLYGSIAAYILFVFFDGYRKLRTGFLPDYLGLYAILVASSGLLSRLTQWETLDAAHINGISFSEILSQIFSLSNYALNIVSSLIMFIFAVYSIGTSHKPDEDASQA